MNIDECDSPEQCLSEATKAEKEGRESDARKFLARCLQLSPDHPIACYRLSICAFEDGYTEEADRLVGIASARFPNEQRVVVHAARIAARRKKLHAAQALFQRALVLDPEQVSVRRELEDVEQAISRAESDRNAGTSAGEERPSDDYLRDATQAEKDGRESDARKLLAQCLEIDPLNAKANHHLSVCALRDGHIEEAERLNAIAIEEAPNSAQIVVHEARIAQKRGDLRRAKTTFQRALVLDPSLIEARNELALIDHTVAREASLSSTKEILGDDKSSEGVRSKELLSVVEFDVIPPFSAFLGDLELGIGKLGINGPLAIARIVIFLVAVFFVIPRLRAFGFPVPRLPNMDSIATLCFGWALIILPSLYVIRAFLQAQNARYQCKDGLLRVVSGAIGQTRSLYEVRHVVQMGISISWVQRMTGDSTLELLVNEGRGAEKRVRLVGFMTSESGDEHRVYQLRELSNLISANAKFKGLRWENIR